MLGKGSNEEEMGDRLLDAESRDETGSLKQMIAIYAGGLNGDTVNATPSDTQYALQVLKELGEAEDASECFLCTSEIFDEVLLPCYHRGYVPCLWVSLVLSIFQVPGLHRQLHWDMRGPEQTCELPNLRERSI